MQAAADVAIAVTGAEAEWQVRGERVTVLEADHAQASQLCAVTQTRLDHLQEEHSAVLKELEAANLLIDDMQHKLQEVAGEKVSPSCSTFLLVTFCGGSSLSSIARVCECDCGGVLLCRPALGCLVWDAGRLGALHEQQHGHA
jgi:hypothetical protein